MECHLDQAGFLVSFNVCFEWICVVHVVDTPQEGLVVPSCRARPADAAAERGRARGWICRAVFASGASSRTCREQTVAFLVLPVKEEIVEVIRTSLASPSW